MKTPTLLLLIITIVTALIGCATELFGSYNYYVETANIGREPISECTVTSASGFRDDPGYVGAGFGKPIAGPFKYPYADRWTVSWRTAKGEKFQKTLDLMTAFPKPFQGSLIFQIDGNNNLTHTTKGFSER